MNRTGIFGGGGNRGSIAELMGRLGGPRGGYGRGMCPSCMKCGDILLIVVLAIYTTFHEFQFKRETEPLGGGGGGVGVGEHTLLGSMQITPWLVMTHLKPCLSLSICSSAPVV